MLNNGEVTHLNALDFLQKEFVNPLMYIHALVTIVHWHLSFKVLVSENSLDVNYTTVSSYPYMYII